MSRSTGDRRRTGAQSKQEGKRTRRSDAYGVRSFGTDRSGYSVGDRVTPAARRKARGSSPALPRDVGPDLLRRPNTYGIFLLVGGLLTAGLAMPVFAGIGFWATRLGMRRTGSSWEPPARTWFVWTLVYAAIGILAYILLIAILTQPSS